jgi:hypothetical protein
MSIVATSFFGTLYMLDWFDPDAVRVRNANLIMAALEKHLAAKGSYPLLPVRDSYASQLAAPLVAGGFIGAIPADPPGTEPIHYASFDGKSFGLWMHFARSGPCKIVVGGPSAGWWGETPACSFR